MHCRLFFHNSMIFAAQIFVELETVQNLKTSLAIGMIEELRKPGCRHPLL